MNSKREVYQLKDSNLIDVSFDVPRVHVSNSLRKSVTLCKVIRTKPNSAKRLPKDTKTHRYNFMTLLHSIVKLLKKSTLFLKTPRILNCFK